MTPLRRVVPATALALAALATVPGLATARTPDAVLRVRPIHGDQRQAPFRHPSVAARPTDAAAYAAAKTEADAALRAPAAAPLLATIPYTTVFNGLNKAELSHADNAARNDSSPPDTTGSIGPGAYVEFVNSKVAVLDRSTLAQTATADLDTFVGATGAAVFDPQIQWDPRGQRWFYLTDRIDSSGADKLAFGFSRTTSPTPLNGTGWCRYSVSTDMGQGAGSNFDDYPKLGHSDSQVLFGTNVFQGPAFVTAHVWDYAKPAAGSITTCPAIGLKIFGSPAHPLRTPSGELVSTPVPADEVKSATNAYVVAADDPLQGTADHITVMHVPPARTLVRDGAVSVPAFTIPPQVPQPLSSVNGNAQAKIDSLDTRLTMAVGNTDPAVSRTTIWTEHTVAGGGGSVVRWYEIVPTNGAPTARQRGTVSLGSRFVFNGAVSPAINGANAAVEYNTGSSANLVDIRARSRTGGQALGTMTGEIVLKTSTTGDNDFTCLPQGSAVGSNVCRWGDYSGAAPDPNNQTVVWGASQWNGSGTQVTDTVWHTQIFALNATG